MLGRARADPDVRRAIAALPVWDRPCAPGRTNALDVTPVADPHVVWRYHPRSKTGGLWLLPSQSVVAATTVRDRGVVLDAATGEERWEAPTPVRDPWIFPQGEVVVLRHRETIRGLEPSTGQALWELPIPPRALLSTSDGDGIVVSTLGEVRLLRLDDPRRAPIERWRTEVVRTPTRSTTASTTCGGGLVILGLDGPAIVAFDAASGDRRFERRGAVLAVDARGLVVGEEGLELVAVSLDGSAKPLHAGKARLLALARDFALLRPYTATFPHSPRPEVLLVDRGTGETRQLTGAELGTDAPVACTRDQIHVVVPRLGSPTPNRRAEPTAWSLAAAGVDGRLRWQLELELPAREMGVASLALSHGRIYAITHRSTVIAIGDRATPTHAARPM